MADFDTKFKEMQKYLPFLQNVIDKLRSGSDQNDDNPRKAQLKKMEVLYDLLKSNGKKLKMETLLKCEGLLIKLHSKMERIPFLQSEIDTSKPTNQTSNLNNTTKTMSNNEVPSKSTEVNETSVEIVDITGPESPPPQPLEEVPPVEIPIERRGSPVEEMTSTNLEQRDKHKHSTKHERHQHQHNHHHHHHPHPHQGKQQQQQQHQQHNKVHHERRQSPYNSRERHQQQNINQNRPGDRSRDQSNDSLNVFDRRKVGTDKTYDNKQRSEHPQNRDPRASQTVNDDIYSPEESWDDIESSKPPSSNLNHITVSTSPASPTTLQDRTFHDTIFNFKKKLSKSNEMFSRVRNPGQPATPTNRAAPPISIPVKVPTIPDVLKSPPLSASDISDLLNDTDSSKSVPSISEIGTRRSVKITSNKPSAPISAAEAAATLDKARKKFAIVTQNSPQLRGSPDILKSPIISTPKDLLLPSTSSSSPSSSSPLPNERIALKYNPHPRTERNFKPNSSNSNNTQPTQPVDPRLNLNRLNSITNKPAISCSGPQDPRLRKAASTAVSPIWNQQPKIVSQKPVSQPSFVPASKAPGKSTHIPSLLEVKVTDPRTSQNVGFPNAPVVPAQQMINNIQTNQSQVGIFSRRDYPAKVAAPLAYGGVPAPPPTVQRSKSGYSSEENWDSEPDELVAPKVVPQAAQPLFTRPFLETVIRNDIPVETSFRPTKPPLLPTPPFARSNRDMATASPHVKPPHFQQVPHKSSPQNPNHYKFSALLNDKTERSKYFESKKQKQSEPRTYMEYKQAKARAAAEEAARKAAVEKGKTTAETDKDIGDVSDVDNTVLAKLSEHPPVTSTLDKLYRSTDFSTCEFPKAKTSFKIPKKVTETTTEKNEPANVENSENVKGSTKEELPAEKSQKDLKKSGTLDKNKSIEKQTPNEDEMKNEVKQQIPKKAQEISSEKKEAQKPLNKGVKKECNETNKKGAQNVKKKTLNKTQAGNQRNLPVKTQAGKDSMQDKPANDTSINDMSPTMAVETEKAATTSAVVEPKPVVETQPALPANTKDKASAESVVQNSVSAKTENKEVKESEEEITPKAVFLKELANIGKPARILKRRNTMMVRGSLPEIDREKIFSIKSLVYEDIQGAREAERRKQLDAKLPKMNKSLAEIFQKTDDNCKVSTQNIITGKRRTRTNVNFNEVQRSLEIFQRKRRSEPLKQHADKSSPSTSKATPKGKKVAKGKAAKNETNDDSVSEQAAGEVDIDQGPVVKTEKATKRKVGRKIKSDPAPEEVETTKEVIDKDDANSTTENQINDKGGTSELTNANTTPTKTAAAVKEKSPKPVTKSDTSNDDDAQKRQLLESFVQDMLNPKKDKAQIFSLLSLILSEDNLKIVKEIVENTVEKTAKQNDEATDETIENESIASVNDETTKMNTSDDKSEGETSTSVVSTPRTSKGKKKRNELDRLNEDIRTMFISQGVLTATGRRMCTLVAAAEQANNTNTSSTSDAQLVQTVAEVEQKTQLSTAEAQNGMPTSLPRIRKSKVILEPINIKEFQKPFDTLDEACESDINNEVKSEMSPPRKMPILKPHTPIKQSEVEDDSTDELVETSKPKKIKLDIKVKCAKPGPKCSKKQQADTVSSDDEAVDNEPSVDLKPTTSVATVKKPDLLKNTNIEWHSQSKWIRWCVLCDKKIPSATHYIRFHGEFYASRLAPDILGKLKEGKMSKPFFGVLQKKMMHWSYRCPFCLQHNRTTQPSWVEHLITHTGEYSFECSNCHRPSSKGHQLETHIKKECTGATAVRKHTIPTGPVLRAHVCHLCNFIQLTRPSIDMHLTKQHGISKLKATKLGYTIDLLDTRDVEIVDIVRAVEWETRIKNEGLESMTMVSNDNTESSLVDVAEQSNTSIAVGNDESMDSDDLPIAKTAVQLKNESTKDQKTAVEKALNSNIFVPTRDTNDSPTMNNFAQSLFTNVQPEITISSAGATGSTGVVSIAERLCQKFKNIQKSKISTSSDVTALAESAIVTTTKVVQVEVEAATTAQNEINQNATEGAEKQPAIVSSTVTTALNTPTVTTALSANDDSTTDVSLTQKSATPKTARTHTNSSAEDDDDDWEDIEVTESAPVKTTPAFSAVPNSNNKINKTKPKNVLQKLNRLYATNNKLKKSLSITIGNRKKEERKELPANKAVSKEKVDKPTVASVAKAPAATTPAADSVSAAITPVHNIPPISKVAPTATVDVLPAVAVSSLIEAPPLVLLQQTTAGSSTTSAISPPPFAVDTPAAVTEPALDSVSEPASIPTADFEQEIMPLTAAPPESVGPNLGFRPLITNLDDLLPDSPCNDPIELVPELTPMESLQDLCDVSSILNSDYMSDNWVSNITPIDLNNDSSQQANMQEALDFVKEQQSVQNNIVTSNNAALAIPSIQRIQNIGYSKSADDNTYKFYCLSKNCTFLYSSEVIGLDTHFRVEHAESTWDGYCHSCKAKIEGEDSNVDTKLPLSAELNHMRSKHLAKISTTALPVVDDLKQPSKSNSPALDEDKPRIKIRRLTGDCLSSTSTPTSAQNTKSVPIFDENAQLVGLAHVEPRTVPTVTTSFLNKIPTTTAQPIENRHFENIGAQEPCTSVPDTPSTQTSTTPTTPCQLQIASVVSLQKQNITTHAVTPTAPLPVISNVCSLNARSVSSPISNTGTLWPQHIGEERAELKRSAADSLEVSRILSNANKNTTPLRHKDVAAAKASGSESPEPEVVAETVAMAQATSGNYLITQTISAQYEEGRLGFNISIANNPPARLSRSDSSSSASTSSVALSTVPQFKCMANGCKYQTRLPVAMGDHLRFHDRQNFSAQREYLRCSICSYHGKDLDDLIQHTDKEHSLLMGNDPELDAIKDILRNADSNGSSGGNNGEEDMVLSFTPEIWETALKELVLPTGVPDTKLFRCTIEDCKTKLSEASYYSHVVYHLTTLGHSNVSTHVYKCPHCKSSFNKPQKIKAHIKTHGIHKYFCYVCTTTTVNLDQMYKHYEQHWRGKKLRNTALPTKAGDKKNWNFYVAHTTILNKYEIDQFREKLVDKWKNKKSSLRTHFKPSEITLLPLTPIFAKDLNCAVCPYKTKVRTNLMRHLQMHADDNNSGGIQHVANVDPINPVPCLNSSERHFDKMTNLASSSLVVGSTSANATTTANGGNNTNGKGGKVPYDYVPDTKRYTCGVSNCQYLTISDDIFRHHLNALHSDIIFYNCPHCKEEICKRNLSIERILNHLRFHGPKLYQCDFCGYLHYMKTVVERHTRQHDVQPPQIVKVTEYDRTKENAAKKIDNTTTPTSVAQQPIAKSTDTQKLKTKQKWSCNLCGHKTMTQPQIIAHALSQHSCKNQYQCMHCAFNAAQLVQIMTHIDEKHAGKKREARYVYTKIEGSEDSSTPLNAIDTRPLWMRDDPKRIRHIRGILMEDEEESERYRKRLRLDDNDDGVEENSEGDENVNVNLFGFLCCYCNAQFTSHEELREQHWQAAKCIKFDVKKPFRFRICTQLKCPHCLSFIGNSLQLLAHMKELHNSTNYLAADPNATAAGLTCGHCAYRGPTLKHLIQHSSKSQHKPLDLKSITLPQLETLKTLGAPLSYVQCLSCMELFTNRACFHEHAQECANDCDVKMLEISDKLIYACSFCPYKSQQEMTVLRHMIDHYSGFKRCCFCKEPQTTFNGYMQHCYSDHREQIKNFCSIYTIVDIGKFLQQLMLIFPNGLTLDLHNLRLTQSLREYGNKHIKLLYDEIQKTSQQPPIPRLSLGRLVAKKFNEAKLSAPDDVGSSASTTTTTTTACKESASASTAAALQLAGNNVKPLTHTFAAQKIMKRRSTIALGRDDMPMTRFSMDAVSGELFNGKKVKKIRHNLDLLRPPPPLAPLSNTAAGNMFIKAPQRLGNMKESEPSSVSDNDASSELEMPPFSYYGQTPEPLDLSKVFIKIAAGDAVETRVNISKFKLLYNITPRVLVTPTDMTNYRKTGAVKRKIIKPCPASHKIRYR